MGVAAATRRLYAASAIVGGPRRAALLGLLLVWSQAPEAGAVSGRWRAGVSAGVAAGTRLSLGPGLGAHVGYGLLESLDVQLAATGSWHDPTHARSTGLVRVFPELVYRFDVVRWVPWIGAGVGYFAALAGQDTGQDSEQGVTLDGSAGVDYLLSRRWSVGVSYRAGWCFGGPARPVHQGLLRLEWRSGW